MLADDSIMSMQLFFRICVPVNIAKKMILLFSLFLVSNEEFQVYAAAVVGIGCLFFFV